MAEDFELPRSYEKYREVLKRTLKKCINIKAEIASTGPFDSKFGGDPYFPKNEAYPVDEGSAPLGFLAQINFEQVPCLKNYPKTGILQFYAGLEAGVAISDDEFKQSGYRVIYFENVEADESKLVSDFSFAESARDELPVSSDSKLLFTKDTQIMPPCDFRFEQVLDRGSCSSTGSGLLEYYDMSDSSGHRIGGYPAFTQEDPRPLFSENLTELLLQVDTDGDPGPDVMWGDAGVGNFFISEEDLKNKNFNKVFFTWDCA